MIVKTCWEKVDSYKPENSYDDGTDNGNLGQNKMLVQTDDRFTEILNHIQYIMQPLIKDGNTSLPFIFE